MNIDELAAGPVIDALVAEQVMEIDLKPNRKLAMSAVAARMISSTGPTFTLQDGRQFVVPNGKSLPDVPGSEDWNSRYFLWIAEQLGSELDEAVEAYRLSPKKYSVDKELAISVLQKLCSDHWEFEITMSRGAPDDDALYHVVIRDLMGVQESSMQYDLALAICQAALKAKAALVKG